jgi:hypothetical protein
VTALTVGADVAGGRSLDSTSALLVKADASTYLVWKGRRFEVRKPDIVLPSLFREQRRASQVGRAWLNGLLEGLPIEPITVRNAGTSSPAVPGRRSGDLLVAQTGSGPQYYLVYDDGIAQITDAQRAVYAGSVSVSTFPISIAQANTMTRSRQLPVPDEAVQPPESPPHVVQPDGGDQICTFSSASGTPVVVVGGSISGDLTTARTAGVTRQGSALADQVVVPSGRAALVRVMVALPNGSTGGFALVTDTGLRYPVGAEALTFLGLSEQQAIGIPATLVNSIPAGPSLDPTAAATPVDMTALPVTGN